MDLRRVVKQNRDSLLFAVIIIFSLISLASQSSRFVQIPDRVGMGLSSAVQSIITLSGDWFKNTISSVAELRDLREEHELLIQELERTRQIFTSIEALEQENATLRELLGFEERALFNQIPARVIAKDPGLSFSSITINKGNRHGIELGMPVVGFQDGRMGLVGKVIQISWSSAIVRPLVDRQSFVAARLSRTRYEGLLSGQGSTGETLLLEYLERDSRNHISVGDEVITSGLNSIFPPDLLIGEVASISSDGYGSSLELEVNPLIEYTRLEHVFVLTSALREQGER